MSPSRGVRWSALFVIAMMACGSLPAVAQGVLDDPNPLLEGPSDPLTRSPRLLGMGRLSYLFDDVHHRINLWDLGMNPVGVVDADTGSTLELAPVTGSNSTMEDPLGNPGAERQIQAGHDFRTYYEAWRRTPSSTYGAVGDWNLARTDVPYDQSLEVRRNIGRPNVMPILAGRLPVGSSKRFLYALRAVAATPSDNDHFRRYVTNGAGQYLDLDGTEVDPPNFFVPNHVRVRTLGIGAQLGVKLTSRIRGALGFDFVNHDILASNDGFRYSYELHESRPYRIGQASIVGGSGGLEWGASARGWRANSPQTWVFSTSGGTATNPLEGRGDLDKRKEEGSDLQARLRWSLGAFELGGGLTTSYRKVETTPFPANDPGSFNAFLDGVFLRNGADTLALADSVVHNIAAERSWQAGGGLGWTWHRSRIGLEGDYFQDRRDQEVGGAGPKRIGWELKSGIEIPVLAAFALRGGYLYRWEDLDDFTRLNEFVTNSATGGFGFHPRSTSWSLDLGYSYDWSHADFSSPFQTRAGSQRLATRLRWLF